MQTAELTQYLFTQMTKESYRQILQVQIMDITA